MKSIKLFLETGKKKTFAGAVDWPGWCRSGRDEETAIQALIDYGPRYAQVLQSRGFAFPFPADKSEVVVTERHDGNSTTDFGAPAAVLDADREPFDQVAFERSQKMLQACWQAFDSAAEQAKGKELQKGPRGGGRDLEKITNHVLDADRGYLSRVAWKHKREGGISLIEELSRTRQAIEKALEVTVKEGLPELGPRGGIIWPPRYFVRRVAWHVLDHAWEIEDRVI
jgi:hypothetical protein